MPKLCSAPDSKAQGLSSPYWCLCLQKVSCISDQTEMDMSREDKFVSAVGSMSWAAGTQSNALEPNEASLRLFSYNINQDLVLRTAFHRLSHLFSTQPPSASQSIYVLLGQPIVSTSLSVCCRACWLQTLFLGWLLCSTNNTWKLFWANLQPHDT